ncbi:MAG: PD-(D/E)XK nuclease family protein [Acidobacteria bacterium]|nr:PD-(D/E)XK nuclease family protein [Acidobacteriota bacterium]
MPSLAGHHDFAVLEARLAELIREVKARDPAGPFAPVAVLVPNDDLRDHVQIALGRSLGALLAVDVMTHEVFAREAARRAGAAIPRRLSPRVREAIAAEAIAAAGGGLAAYVTSRPGSAAAILTTLNELREAGVDAARAAAVESLSPRAIDLLRVHKAYAARLDELLPRGLSDRAGSLGAARPHVAAHARRYRLVVHYGAYELIGANLALMREIGESGTPLVFLLPWHPTSPAFEHARRRLPLALGATVTPIEPAFQNSDSRGTRDARLLAARLPALYDHEAAPPALPPGPSIEYFHAQGPAAELGEVALRILALHRDEGVPLQRVAVIARTLEPYAPLLRPAFGDRGVPFTTAATVSALREPHALAALHLVRAAAGDFERQPLLDLFRSGLWRCSEPRAAGSAHAWEKLSRMCRVTRGLRSWTQDLPRWMARWKGPAPEHADDAAKALAAEIADRSRSEAASLAAEVQSIADAFDLASRAASWAEWSERVRETLVARLTGFAEDGGDATPAPGVVAIRGVLGEMKDLDVAGATFTVTSAPARFERAIREARVPAPGVTEGGVKILDALRARGLAFDAVFLIGFNGDIVPRRTGEDPFLRDEDRRTLAESLAAPLTIRGAAREEEHLLLAHLLGAARRKLVVSWQRADANGRAKAVSLALREIARVTLGGPRLEAIEAVATRVGAHPLDAARDAAARFRMLPTREARLGSALSLPSPAHVRRAVADFPPESASVAGTEEALAAGLEMLDAIDELAPARLDYDGAVGDAAPPPDVWSPSRLEALGACPQQYFFRYHLRVEEMGAITEPHELDAREMGLAVHAVLAEVYSALERAPELFGPGADPAKAASRALDLLRAAWPKHTSDIAERMHARVPLLWSETSKLWRNALETFVLFDAPSLARDGGAIVGVERAVKVLLPTPSGGPRVEIQGRVDRATRRGTGEIVVADYKTGRNLEPLVEMRDVLKGTRLQIALYALAAESEGAAFADRAEVRAEVIGIGPGHAEGIDAPAADVAAGYPARAPLDPKKFAAGRAGVLETIGVLARLAASGNFPLDKSDRCRYCPYTRACRKSHAPTVARLRAAPGAADFYRLRGKSTQKPLLADVGDAEEDS